MTDDELIAAYREKYPEGEDSSGIESNPLCGRCNHTRGMHEVKGFQYTPFGYCITPDCDCTHYVDEA